MAYVSDCKATYLLPCSCGQEILIEPRQAGGTVQCQCGQTCVVPTLREVQRLRPAPDSSKTSTAAEPAWGNPQRFLAAGLVLVALAGIAAVILDTQFPAHFGGLPSPEAERQHVKSLSTLQTMEYLHARLLPGIDYYERAAVQSRRTAVYLGMAALAGLGVIGLLLVAVGIAGIVRGR